MEKSRLNDCLVANDVDELLAALKVKAPRILITKYYKKEFLENTETPLPEENLFSYSRVGASLGGNPIFLLMNIFSKKEKKQRIIDKRVQKYLLKEYGEDLLLEFRMLYY